MGVVLRILFIGLVGASRGLSDDDAQAVVVVANRNVPESVELAKVYMQARSIPANHLCVVDLPVGGTIVRYIYERRLRDPLLDFLRK